MKVLFFDVGYTLVNEDAVWEARCREQAQTNEAKKLELSATDIYHEIEIASIARKPQFRTLINKYNFKEVAPYRTELETLYKEAPAVIKIRRAGLHNKQSYRAIKDLLVLEKKLCLVLS